MLSRLREENPILIEDFSQTSSEFLHLRDLVSYQFNKENLANLEREFSLTDFKSYLASMKGSKAPGRDGMSARFFEHFWDIVGADLGNMSLNFLNSSHFLRKFNFTLITLVPKIERPINMTQFRPFVLYNTVTEVISKMMERRLKFVLPSVISESQSVVVPNRLIIDNVLLGYETHHFIKHKKMGNLGFMFIKLDMLKAYDRIEWSFLRPMLAQLHFSDKWIRLIMEYVESVTYSVMINGEQAGFLKPRRGLRQGHSLSPYLFIICIEGFISILKAT
ncbi:hypothetical protein LIER_04609 [Lithospermum erythrorhizon]|uniref:Reverse transcriptase domain-containing protein n=1 Tax=Lithospermum erythrorhizon TaxID=34254 RepID=A0AAV3NXJ4_LITER